MAYTLRFCWVSCKRANQKQNCLIPNFSSLFLYFFKIHNRLSVSSAPLSRISPASCIWPPFWVTAPLPVQFPLPSMVSPTSEWTLWKELISLSCYSKSPNKNCLCYLSQGCLPWVRASKTKCGDERWFSDSFRCVILLSISYRHHVIFFHLNSLLKF